jgi:hypothetical protein
VLLQARAFVKHCLFVDSYATLTGEESIPEEKRRLLLLRRASAEAGSARATHVGKGGHACEPGFLTGVVPHGEDMPWVSYV